MGNKIRVMIVEDDILALKLDKALISKEDDMEVVGVASTKEEAIPLALELKPDVLLADINLTDKEDQYGIDVAIEVSIKSPETKIVMLSGLLNEDTVRSTIGLDIAQNYILKSKPEIIPQTIRDAYNNISTLESSVVDFIRKDYNEALKTTMKFTKSQIKVLELFYRGYSIPEVADALKIEIQSVNNCRQEISKRCLGWKWRFKRLSPEELAKRAKAMGLL